MFDVNNEPLRYFEATVTLKLKANFFPFRAEDFEEFLKFLKKFNYTHASKLELKQIDFDWGKIYPNVTNEK